MTSILAGTLAVLFHTLGIAFGALLWGCIGYGIGCLTGTPTTGAWTGIAWHAGCYLIYIEQMAQSIERGKQKFQLVLENW